MSEMPGPDPSQVEFSDPVMGEAPQQEEGALAEFMPTPEAKQPKTELEAAEQIARISSKLIERASRVARSGPIRGYEGVASTNGFNLQTKGEKSNGDGTSRHADVLSQMGFENPRAPTAKERGNIENVKLSGLSSKVEAVPGEADPYIGPDKLINVSATTTGEGAISVGVASFPKGSKIENAANQSAPTVEWMKLAEKKAAAAKLLSVQRGQVAKTENNNTELVKDLINNF